MSAIIAMLIAELSKILIPALIKWIESLFNKTAKKLEATGDDEADAEMLVAAAIDATPRVRVFKRALLRRVKDSAAKIASGGKLSASDKAELLALAKPASKE